MHKTQHRQSLKAQRATLTSAQRAYASEQCIEALGQHAAWQQAKDIAIYQATADELCLHALITSPAADGKQLHLPVIHPNHKGQMAFYPWHTDMPCVINRFGISEPSQQTCVTHIEQIDLMVVPCLGLTEQGHRLGTGGGYYDRYLNHPQRPQVLGVAYDIQRCCALPIDPWDQHCDVVIFVKTP